MEVLDFINREENWEEVLAAEPYSLRFDHDGDYILLKYILAVSDMSNPIVQECRGIIVRKDDNGKYVCVCRAMDKFFNWGESNAHSVDWDSAAIQEKIDGSLIKVWYDRGEWHISTNGIIRADKYTLECGKTFQDIFLSLKQFEFTQLDTKYTYWFELVSHYAPVTVEYTEDCVYYLGKRNMETMEEELPLEDYGLHPRTFRFSSLEECVAAASVLDKSQEGYVVCDKRFQRIKIKGKEYLELAHISNNNLITLSYLIELWRNGKLDDLESAFPRFTPEITKFHSIIQNYLSLLDETWLRQNPTLPKKEFAASLRGIDKVVAAYCFARYDGKTNSAIEFVFGLRNSVLERAFQDVWRRGF